MTDLELPAVELETVPFFPQSRYQCGPAALATVLGSSGVEVRPDDLVAQTYVPGRRGSFQVELKAAARRYGRIPLELEPTVDALIDEVAAGRPVLVLQNLGFDWAPVWHYAVVVGFEPGRRQVILRSGRQRRRLEPVGAFLRSWARAEHWAAVLLRPGELARGGSATEYLQSLVDAGAFLSPEAFAAGLRAGLDRWPDAPDLTFASANRAREDGLTAESARLYRRTLALDARHLGALNNYADLLHDEGCITDARALIDRAVALAPEASPLRAVLEQTRAEISASAQTPATAPPDCVGLAP